MLMPYTAKVISFLKSTFYLSVYYRYVLSIIINYFFIISVIFISIIYTFSSFLLVQYIINWNIGLVDIIYWTLLMLIEPFMLVSPMILVMSIYFCYTELDKNREYYTFLRLGISFARIINPIIIFSFSISSLIFFISFFLLPFVSIALENHEYRLINKYMNKWSLSYGVFHDMGRDIVLYSQKNKIIFMYYKGVDQGVIEPDSENNTYNKYMLLTAPEWLFLNEGEGGDRNMLLIDGSYQLYNSPTDYTIGNFQKYQFAFPLMSEIIQDNSYNPSEDNTLNLLNKLYMYHTEGNYHVLKNSIIVQVSKRLVPPVATFLLGILSGLVVLNREYSRVFSNYTSMLHLLFINLSVVAMLYVIYVNIYEPIFRYLFIFSFFLALLGMIAFLVYRLRRLI